MEMERVLNEFRANGIGLNDESLSLSEWNRVWRVLAGLEINRIRNRVECRELKISHIGSTAIEGLSAKPIIDLIGEVIGKREIDFLASGLKAIGYTALGEFGIEGRRFFALKDSSMITYVHLHVFAESNERVLQHILFRDYLASNREALTRYERFKLSLLHDRKVVRSRYSEEKEIMMQALSQEALSWNQKKRGS